MNLPTMNMDTSETGCCPVFDPSLWDEKTIEFNGELFAKTYTKSFFYMPLNMSKVMTETMKSINDSDAEIKDKYLILSRDISKWKCEHYFLVKKEISSIETVKLDGNYLTKVFEGPYRDFPKWMTAMENYVKSQNKTAKKIYAFYTTCPKCAAHYGKNYVVLFAEI